MTSLPEPIQEAVRALEQHPAVSAVLRTEYRDAGYEVEVRVPVPLPSRAVQAGVSATGVRGVEDVVFCFPPKFPLEAPTPYLRVDFPANLPHVNPHKRGERVPPCIFEGSASELMHRFGLDRIVDQTSGWLKKAAANQLIDPDQGWEPVRRPESDAEVSFDADQVTKALLLDGSVLTIPTGYGIADKSHYFKLRLERAGQVELLQQKSYKQGNKETYGGQTSSFVLAAPAVDGELPVCSEYAPDTVTDLDSLFAMAFNWGISVEALRAALESWLLQSDLATTNTRWPAGMVAVVILAVRRPTRLVGTQGRTVEFVPYQLRVPADVQKASVEHLEVLPAWHSRALSPELLARMSGNETVDRSFPYAVVGCGSVGSKIAAHLGRSGFGNVSLIDNENFLPHNTARNALNYEDSDFRSPKATMMSELFGKFGHQQVQAYVTDIVPALIADDPKVLQNLLPADCKLVVDATASLKVGAAAVVSKHLTDVRLVRTMLYGQGRAAVMMLEGAHRSPRLDDLNAALFAVARNTPQVRHALSAGSADPTKVFIGDNCASMTMPMSDSVVSRGTSMMAMQLERWIASGLPHEGYVAVGMSDLGDIGMNWVGVPIKPPVVLEDVSGGWTVRVAAHVMEFLEQDALHWLPKETGGALVGVVDPISRTAIIAGVVAAPPDSVRKRERFDLGIVGLAQSLKQANEDSIGYLRYIGTWHSHPMGGSHSEIDMETLRKLADFAGGLPMVSLVWTPTGLQCKVERV